MARSSSVMAPMPGVTSHHEGGAVRFSELFGITRTTNDDWFDPVITVDTPLFVQPELIFSDDDPDWSRCRGIFAEYFELAGLDVSTTQHGAKTGSVNRFLFPEPTEFALGRAIGTAIGTGIGAGLGRAIAGNVRRILNAVEIDRFRVEALGILGTHIGQDRISDMTCNILKAHFVMYTAQVVAAHSIPTEPVTISNCRWDTTGWRSERFNLPVGPKGAPILLVPARFLSALFPYSQEGFYDWAVLHKSRELRAEMSHLINESIRTVATRRQRGEEFAIKRPDIVIDYLEAQDSRILPYDVESDDRLLSSWLELGRAYARQFITEASKLGDLAPDRLVLMLTQLLAKGFDHGLARDAFWGAGLDARPRGEDAWSAAISTYLAVLLSYSGIRADEPWSIGRGLTTLRYPGGRVVNIHVTIAKVAKLARDSNGTMQSSNARIPSAALIVALAFDNADADRRSRRKIDHAAQQINRACRRPAIAGIINVRQNSNAHQFLRLDGP